MIFVGVMLAKISFKFINFMVFSGFSSGLTITDLPFSESSLEAKFYNSQVLFFATSSGFSQIIGLNKVALSKHNLAVILIMKNKF